MDPKKNMFLVVFLVFIIILSLLAHYFSGFSYPSAKENEIVLVEVREGEDIGEYGGIEVLDEYGNQALVKTRNENIRSLRKDGFQINELESRTTISVRGHTFDISEGEPDLEPDMKIESYQEGEEGLYLIHMLGPINPEWRDKLLEKNIEIINYVPNYAYEVKMTSNQAEKIEELFFIDWVGIYHPAYKFAGEIESEKVNVRFAPNTKSESLNDIRSSSMVRSSITPEGAIQSIVYNHTSHQELKKLASINDVYSISEYTQPELHSEIDAQIIGGGAWIMDDEHGDPSIPYRKHGDFGAYINQIGYSGEDVTIAVADTGIGDGKTGDAGHPDLTDRVIGGYGFGQIEEWEDGHGHGTHVTGSAAGDTYLGTGKAGSYPGYGPYYMGQGLAYNSELYAAKIFSDAGDFLLDDDYYPIIEIPKQESETYIHANSWGSSTEGSYIESDKIFDQAVRDANRDSSHNEPMVITVSAGNSGAIEQSTNSPGNAKNVITIGATESYMQDGSDYGGSNTDNPNLIASFSSRGWTEDNRVKPDVVAPGQNVLSLGNPTFSEGGTYDWKSGTSMSNPTVAGAAAVTVEWYEKNFGERPSPAMVKSLLINTAHDIQREECRSEHIPNKDEGWGMVDISKLEYPKEDPVPFLVEDQTSLLQTGESDTYDVKAEREGEPLKISLVWTDKNAMEGDAITLKNDLNLEVESPSGKTYRGNAFSGGWTHASQSAIEDFDRKEDGWDDVNNVQNIYIDPDEVEEGTYSIKVDGFNIPEDGTNDGVMNQDYALVIYNGENSEMDTGPKNRVSDLADGYASRSEDTIELNSYSEREPIHIDGDEEFENKVESEGWFGSGTEDDPFVIDGYAIDGEEKITPISIENVESHFVVKNNRLHNANRSREAIAGHSGIYLYNTQNGEIFENELELNSFGILMENSHKNIIKNNTALNNHVGFRLYSSNENIIRNNDARKISYPTYDEGIYLEESENNTLLNNHVVNNHDGILLDESNRNLLRNNNESYNTRGLRLNSAEFNEIIGENLWKNSAYGLYLFESNKNELMHFESVSNIHGGYIRSSEKNLLMENYIKNNLGIGVRFSFSDRNKVINNTISENGGDGLSLSYSQNHTISSNNFLKDGINLLGDSVEYWNTHDIDINNTVEGKPIHYLSNLEEVIIDENTNAGQIILANSTDIVIEEQHIDTGDLGFILGFSDGNRIHRNTITNQRQGITIRYSHQNRLSDNELFKNHFGIYMVQSEKNSISENNISDNDLPGLILFSSNNNLIFGNELFDNYIRGLYLINSYDNTLYHNKIYHSEQKEVDNQSLAYDDGRNRWDHRSEGNYWSNYEKNYPGSEEIKGTGTWDTSYDIEGSENKDKYPLVSPRAVDDLEVTIIEPGRRETVFNSDVKVRWGSKGASEESITWIRLNGEEWIEIDEGYEYTFNNLSDGYHEVEVRVEDKHNFSIDQVDFEVNTEVFVEITRPESRSIERRSTVPVEWMSQNMEYNEIRLEGEGFDEENWIDVGVETEYIFRNLPDGRYTVSVRAIDEEGNHYQDSVGFNVKTVSIEIQSPVEDEVFGSPNVTIQWNSDNAVSHEIRICGGRWDRIGDVDEHTYTNLKSRDYEVSVRARDESGRSGTDSVSFTIDTTPPLIQIVEPVDGEVIISNRLNVKWEGEDEITQIDRFEIRFEGGEWIDVDTDTKYTFENLESGIYTIEVRAWDRAGNSEIDRVTIEIVEDDTLRLRDYWWLISIIAVILVVILDILFWRKEDKRKIPSKGRLLRLQRELDEHDPDEIVDDYKL